MGQNLNHKQVIERFLKEFKSIFDNSEQAMYLYLDDENVSYNEKFASLLGYNSVNELNSVKESFLSAFVDEKSQSKLANAYGKSMEKMIGCEVPISWKTKTGKKVNTKVILVPVVQDGHLMALHFISK